MKTLEIRAKYNSTCSGCGKQIRIGQLCWWMPKAKRVKCTKCEVKRSQVMQQRRYAVKNTWGGMRT